MDQQQMPPQHSVSFTMILLPSTGVDGETVA
jgi:hypothetical protein